jgi:hypothetical protein
MPEFIILRLHPSEPTAPADFVNLLTGLSVSPFDLSHHTADGALVGTATGLADPHLTSTNEQQRGGRKHVDPPALRRHPATAPRVWRSGTLRRWRLW